MAYTTINDPTQYFQTALWTGTGGALTVTNDGNSDLKPDFLWVKNRNNTGGHRLHDSNRPLNNTLKSHVTDAEGTETDLDMTFETDGFSLDKNAGDWNFSGRTYVGWQWKANGGTTSSNTDGTITSTVQANTTAGFSIVTWTSDGTDAKSIGHGLNQKPDMIIVKNRSYTDATQAWHVWHQALDSGSENGEGFLWLDNTNAETDYNYQYLASDSSLIYPQGNRRVRGNNGDNMISYIFHGVKGYSKFGSYTGNGSNDGPFVYTGFKPAFVMFKRTDSANWWIMWDSTRNTFNVVDKLLQAQDSAAELTATGLDINSNGFKLRTDGAGSNASGGTYIYMAFAESPFVSSDGVPTTAR